MLVNADMTAFELVSLARAVCDNRLNVASEPFRHFTVSVYCENGRCHTKIVAVHE